jgi:hypothetical protein
MPESTPCQWQGPPITYPPGPPSSHPASGHPGWNVLNALPQNDPFWQQPVWSHDAMLQVLLARGMGFSPEYLHDPSEAIIEHPLCRQSR